MRQSLSQKQKAQERFYGSPENSKGFVLRVVVSGKKSEVNHYRDDFEREDDLPDYWGRLDPNVILPFDFEEEQYECEA